VALGSSARSTNGSGSARANRLTGDYDFFCECEDETCTGVLRLNAQEYRSVRADTNQFAVLPGHERPTDEVIRGTERFLIVRKGGDGDPAQTAGSEPNQSEPNQSERR